jgi:hypothetical protein
MTSSINPLSFAGALLLASAASGSERPLSANMYAQALGDCSAPAFAVAELFPAGSPLLGPMQAGDLTGDDAPELAILDGPRNAVVVMRNDGAGRFESRVSVPAGSSPQAVAIGDFTSDRRPDIAVGIGDWSSPYAVLVLPADGTGGFGAPISTPLTDQPLRMAVGSFNAADVSDSRRPRDPALGSYGGMTRTEA